MLRRSIALFPGLIIVTSLLKFRQFLKYILTRVSISTFLSFFSIFTEEHGTTINNEDRKESKIAKI